MELSQASRLYCSTSFFLFPFFITRQSELLGTKVELVEFGDKEPVFLPFLCAVAEVFRRIESSPLSITAEHLYCLLSSRLKDQALPSHC